jgi:predicted Fe-S protein YdhL (DUF1289 family)
MQLEFFDVPSPCVGICQADDKGHCLGCMRTRDERLSWSSFNNDDKQKVIKRCLQRKKRKLNKNTPKQVELPKEENLQPSLLEPSNKTSQKPIKNSTLSDDKIDFSDFEL